MSEDIFGKPFFYIMDDLVYMYAIAEIFKFNPLASRQLIDAVGDLPSLFSMNREELEGTVGRWNGIIEQFLNDDVLERSRREIEWANSKGVKMLSVKSKEYPYLLKECEDAPVVIFYLGSADLGNGCNVSMVGTRLASSYGRQAAASIVSDLAEQQVIKDGGLRVVSGLAYGIDIAAHKSALEAGLETIGILPCGIDLIYPKAHRDIARKMVKHGGLITEFPHGFDVRRWQFIKRNRIIAGISAATIAVETRIKGGSMSTVEFANSYGRDVYAVPGRIDDFNSFGCNYLISKNVAQIYTRDAAAQICGVKGSHTMGLPGDTNLFSFEDAKKEKILLSLKVDSALDTDAICNLTGIPFNEIASLLLEMELEGKVVVVQGQRYRKSSR